MKRSNNVSMKNILVTGGTSGLGLAVVRYFLAAGHNVWATGRDIKNINFNDDRFHFLEVDFSDLNQVSEVINNLNLLSLKFDIIINNAGILSPPSYTTTKNGLEYALQVNFLSHLLIDELIIKRISNSDVLTVVSVTSPVYKHVKPGFRIPDAVNYRSFISYAESKLYLLLIGEYLHNKYPQKNLKFIGFNPGVFGSGIYRMQKNWFQNMYRIAAPFMRSPGKVARNLIKILEQENLVYGNVYSKPAFSQNIRIKNSGEARKFMDECGYLIIPYLK